MRLVISVHKITRALTLAISCLTIAWFIVKVTAYYTGDYNLFGLIREFDLDGEANIPAWYQSAALLLCSGLLGTIAAVKKADSDRFAAQLESSGNDFLFLSIDETALIHDMMT